MSMRSLLLLFFGGGLGLIGIGSEGLAQAPERPAQRTVLARFEEAQALAVDPVGRLYVADAGRDVVEILNPDGTRREVLGGAGTRAGEFDLPSDVDPTNGQLLLVADTYNGRVQRFSEEGQYLESLPIGRMDRFGAEAWGFEDGRGGNAVRGDGRPIAVARDDEGAIFVLDRRERRLLKWSDLGRSERIVGGKTGRLHEPVALAVGGARQVYVADAGHEGVLAYDPFGTFLQQVPIPPLPTVRALTIHRGRLHIVCAERVVVWDRTDGLVADHSVELSAPLVDVALRRDTVYLLTETQLVRSRGW